MTSSIPLPLSAATHVAFDPFTPDRLARLGATSVVRATDRLHVGPSRRAAPDHVRARAAWWPPDDEEGDRLYAPDVRWDRPVVLWVASSIGDRINLWRTCSWLREIGVSHRDILVLELPLTPHPNPTADRFGCSHSVVDHPDEALLAHLAAAAPWSRAHHDRAVNLWELYTEADPSRFVRAAAQGVPEFPELPRVWRFLANFLPRQEPDGTLRPSRYDELLLGRITDQWQTGVQVYLGGDDEWRALLTGVGDLIMGERLDQWALHGATPAIERTPGPSAEIPMKTHVYRITEHGQRLRDHGLALLTDAPSLPVAGTMAYAAPWVLRPDGTLG
jgi:hypothetical protein